jgi:uncharacterized membrane protein YsdA (DUF1294 family)/cold shock CspA family protein
MRYLGTLVEWNDGRGFGFVQADAGGERVFVHISAFQPKPVHPSRPQTGMRLEFAVGLDNGKKRAQQVAWRHIGPVKAVQQPVSATPRPGKVRSGGGTYFVVIAFALLFVGVAGLWGVQRWVASLYVVLSLITFFAYWKDKMAAQAGRWRTPESTLHTLALLGGWPGAIFAQQWLRHKSSKAQFRSIFWATVLLNVSIFVWLHSPWGRDWLPVLHTT